MKKQNKNPFTETCICDWSKDNEFGFIPYKECSVHGKEVKAILKEAVPYEVKMENNK